MNEKTYHISPKKLAEADAFTARIYPESVPKAVWRRIRKPSRKTILKLLPAPDFAVLRAAELTLSHGYRYFGIINEAEGYAITNTNAYAIGNMAFGNSYSADTSGHEWVARRAISDESAVSRNFNFFENFVSSFP